MADYYSPFEMICSHFKKNKIPFTSPGFYDHPNFFALEKKKPEYLNNYARFVHSQKYDNAYLDRSRKIIQIVVQTIHAELVKSGRKGACVDASMVISRILEKEGIWNYAVKGALTIKFPAKAKIKPLYFWPYDLKTGANVGHAWIYAPPFNVIDISIKQQPYSKGVTTHLPETVLETNLSKVAVDNVDILSTEVMVDLMRRGIPEDQIVFGLMPQLKNFFKTFPANQVVHNKTTLKYTPCAITASDAPLEEITALDLSGKTGYQIYNEVIKPKIKTEIA